MSIGTVRICSRNPDKKPEPASSPDESAGTDEDDEEEEGNEEVAEDDVDEEEDDDEEDREDDVAKAEGGTAGGASIEGCAVLLSLSLGFRFSLRFRLPWAKKSNPCAGVSSGPNKSEIN